MERTKMPNLRNGNKEGFEPGLTWLRVRHSTTELPHSTKHVREGGRGPSEEGGRAGGREGPSLPSPLPPSRAKPGNRLVYYIKLQRPFVCLSPPFFRHDRRTTTKFGTHIRVDMGLILSEKTIWPTPPQGGPMGVFRGSKNEKSGEFHELPRKSIHFF